MSKHDVAKDLVDAIRYFDELRQSAVLKVESYDNLIKARRLALAERLCPFRKHDVLYEEGGPRRFFLIRDMQAIERELLGWVVELTAIPVDKKGKPLRDSRNRTLTWVEGSRLRLLMRAGKDPKEQDPINWR